MNKNQLVSAIAEKAEITKKDAEKFLKVYEVVIKDALVAGEKVQSVGFGTFEVSERKEREGINPRTKEPMTIPASKTVKFKVGKALKDAVNN